MHLFVLNKDKVLVNFDMNVYYKLQKRSSLQIQQTILTFEEFENEYYQFQILHIWSQMTQEIEVVVHPRF